MKFYSLYQDDCSRIENAVHHDLLLINLKFCIPTKLRNFLQMNSRTFDRAILEPNSHAKERELGLS